MFEGEFLHEEENNNPPPVGVVLSVQAFLQAEFGFKRGAEIYATLKETAKLFALYDDMGGKPGILFNDNGGEFVSLDDD